MEDKRSLYINQLLNHYRHKSVFNSIELYPVTYRYENSDKPTCLYFRHNEGLDVIRDYIRDLERKLMNFSMSKKLFKQQGENNNDME